MFFKKLSRSRTNSYIDDDYERSPSHDGSRAYENGNGQGAYDANGPPSAYKSHGTSYDHTQGPPLDSKDADNMYTARTQDRGVSYSSQHSNGTRPVAMNGAGPHGINDNYNERPVMTLPMKTNFAAPDLLTQAFNEAVRPYTEKIGGLEQQIADLQAWVEQLEQQRQDVHTWIDKRGLRPDVPPAIAKHMDANSDAANSLSAQLDRKITIVNFDLHRLQDDLNDSISSAHFAAAMSKFLPDVQRLAHLPSGPRYAYELLIKIVGNLNSHGGLEANGAGGGGSMNGADEIEEDRRARANFYDRMDGELLEVVKRRTAEGEDWPIAKEVKRLEKTGAYLKNLGIEPYFPRSLDLMRQEADFRNQGTPPRYS